MSEKQKLHLASKIREAQARGHKVEFHHGDCVGADAEADNIARNLGCDMFIHPPENPKLRAFCAQPGDKIYDEKPYTARNCDIVDFAECMFGAPKNHLIEEFRGSGTWTTIRYAKKRKALYGYPLVIDIMER